MEEINLVVDSIITFMMSYGVFLGVFIIMLESIIPILPLSVFITLNVASYGGFIGIIISWLATIIGCILSFFLFRKLFRKKLYKMIKKKDMAKLSSIMIVWRLITYYLGLIVGAVSIGLGEEEEECE